MGPPTPDVLDMRDGDAGARDTGWPDSADVQTSYVCESLEFDAPRFRNFDKTPYRKRLQLIEAILLDPRSMACYGEGEYGDYEGGDYEDGEYENEDDKDNDIDWFQRVHNSHEASVPPSPPVPLITPVVIKKVGLGSPGRVVRSTSSGSSSANGATGKRRLLNSPLRGVRAPAGLSPLRLALNSPLLARSNLVHQEAGSDDDCLARSPSPPSLVNDVANLDALDPPSRPFSRRESGNVSDIDLFRDELIDMSSRTTIRSENAPNRVTMMRPQRVLVSAEGAGNKRDMSPIARRTAKVDAQLCPPPGVRKPEPATRAALPSSFQRFAAKAAVHERDIKKMLSEHNQRVRKR